MTSPIAGEFVTETFEYDGGRQVTVYVPRQSPEAVVFAGDGGWHIARLSEALKGAKAPPTMIVGVHGLDDDDGRLKEYVPGFDPNRFAAFEHFLVNDVGRWVPSRFGVALPADRTAIWGASLGGELALFTGLRHPDIFGVVFSASPGGSHPPDGPIRIRRAYLVAGTQEPWFLENATRWADALRNTGADVVMMEREGEHGGAFWGEEFPLMVSWAFGR